MYFIVFHPAIFCIFLKKWRISRTDAPIYMIFSLKFIINQYDMKKCNFKLVLLNFICKSALNCLKLIFSKPQKFKMTILPPHLSQKRFDLLTWNLAETKFKRHTVILWEDLWLKVLVFELHWFMYATSSENSRKSLSSCHGNMENNFGKRSHRITDPGHSKCLRKKQSQKNF